MLRFIFVCMTMVGLSILSISAQYMLNGIQTHRAATANVAAVEPETLPTGPSFEQIYANAPQAEITDDAASLNELETAAGGNEFSAPFTNTAPKALADDEVPMIGAAEIVTP